MNENDVMNHDEMLYLQMPCCSYCSIVTEIDASAAAITDYYYAVTLRLLSFEYMPPCYHFSLRYAIFLYAQNNVAMLPPLLRHAASYSRGRRFSDYITRRFLAMLATLNAAFSSFTIFAACAICR